MPDDWGTQIKHDKIFFLSKNYKSLLPSGIILSFALHRCLLNRFISICMYTICNLQSVQSVFIHRQKYMFAAIWELTILWSLCLDLFWSELFCSHENSGKLLTRFRVYSSCAYLFFLYLLSSLHLQGHMHIIGFIY